MAVTSVLIAATAAAAPRSLYVTTAEKSTASVSSFPITLSSGALGTETTTLGNVAGSNSTASAMSPDGTYLYTANAGADRVDVFTVNQSNGTLTSSSISGAVAGMASMFAVAVSPNGKYLYAVGNSGQHNPGSTSMTAVQAFTISAADGSLTPDGPLATDGVSRAYANPETALALAVSPDGGNLFTATFANNEISNFVVNQANGQLGAVTNVNNGAAGSSGPFSLAVSPANDALYVADDGNGVNGLDVSVYPLSGGVLGTRTDVPSGGINPGAVAASPDGARVYVANEGDGTNANPTNVASFGVNADGSLAPLPSVAADPGAGFPQSLTVTPDGGHVYAGNIVSTSQGDVEVFGVGAGGALTALGNGATDTVPFLSALVVSPNQGPTANLAAPSNPTAGTPVQFNATGSTDSDGTVAHYDWNFGDGTVAKDAGPTPTHTYHQAGSVTTTVTVTDNEGCANAEVYTGQTASCNGSSKAVASQTFTLATPPPPHCSGDAKSSPYNTAVDVPLTCTGSGLSYQLTPGAGPHRGTATISGSTLRYTPNAGASGADSFSVTATDAVGQTATDAVTVTIGAPPGGGVGPGGVGPGAIGTQKPPVITDLRATRSCARDVHLFGTPHNGTSGLAFSFNLSEDANVLFVIKRRDGSPQWSRCPNGHGRSQETYTDVGQLVAQLNQGHPNVSLGTAARHRHVSLLRRLFLRGGLRVSMAQVTGGQKLSPGTYVLLVRATNSAGQTSNDALVKFWVTR